MRRHYLIAIGLLVLVAAVFAEVPRMDFLDWDDPGNVFDNPYYRPVTWGNVAELWRRPLLGFYIPVTRTVWAGIAALAVKPGVDPAIPTDPGAFPSSDAQPFRPAPFHIANVALHLANVLLVFGLLRLLGFGDWPAAAGAAVFGVHPAQVEPVAWVTGLKDVLAAFLALAALYQYLAYARVRNEGLPAPRWRYVAGLLLFALAVLSKQTVAVLPLIAFALEVGVLGRPWQDSARALARWLPVAAAGAALASWTDPGLVATDLVPWWQRPFVAGDALAFYLGKLAAPIRLMAHYGRAPTVVMAQPWAYVTWLAPAAVIAALVLARRRAPGLTAAGAVFVIGVLPVLGLRPYFNQDVGTRFTYLALLGGALAVAWVARRWPTKATGYVVVAVLAVLGWTAMMESLYWSGSVALFERTVALNPRSWAAHSSLGKIEEARGNVPAAEAHYRAAIDANPTYVPARLNFGALLQATGRIDGAIEQFGAALHADPLSAAGHESLGAALLAKGDVDEGAEQLRRAIELSPGLWRAHFNLAAALLMQQDFAGAEREYRMTIALNPAHGPARVNLGLALLAQGRKAEARAVFEEARRMGMDVELPPEEGP